MMPPAEAGAGLWVRAAGNGQFVQNNIPEQMYTMQQQQTPAFPVQARSQTRQMAVNIQTAPPSTQRAPCAQTVVSGVAPVNVVQSSNMITKLSENQDGSQMIVTGPTAVPQAPIQVVTPTSMSQAGALAAHITMAGASREQMLEKENQELRQQLASKDKLIKELQARLSNKSDAKRSSPVSVTKATTKARSPTARAQASGFNLLSGSQPMHSYNASSVNDEVDLRLEDFYNGTGSAIAFQRINRGFYRFGDTIAELDIINNKLMARTEDWNRGKFGPIEKFLCHFENIEREKAGIPKE